MSLISEDADPSGSHAAARGAAASPVPTQLPNRVTFNRFELNRILKRAVFSVFRRACDVPVFRIEKDPRLARKQGMYSVISATGLILRRGHELDRVLLVIDRKPALV